MKSPRIEIPNGWGDELSKEFDCSTQTVRMSLQFVFNSDQAYKIRAKARQMLLDEANKVDESGEFVELQSENTTKH